MVSAEFQLSMLKASLDFDPHIVGSQVVLEEEEELLIEESRKHTRRSLGEYVIEVVLRSSGLVMRYRFREENYIFQWLRLLLRLLPSIVYSIKIKTSIYNKSLNQFAFTRPKI
jgi:hypothetical protein